MNRVNDILIIVDRFPSERDWTLSEFFIDGIRRGVGVEDENRDVKVKGETRVDSGIYELDLRHSPKFSHSYYADDEGYLNKTKTDRFKNEHQMIWVKGTPRHEFILWHWGSTDDNTDGCYIVGSSFATFDKQKGVSGSRIKYTEIYPVIFQHIKRMKALGIVPKIQYREKPPIV
jgi:hypothetical protein